MSVLEVRDVSIIYKVGDFKDIGLKDWFVKKLKGTYVSESFYADKHISFSLEAGDMLGIIGSNGAGKSTLLKAISGIMRPSEGQVICDKNVVALLELGSGFDPELSVKENTFLRGALMGYTRKFMMDKYDEIMDFAELREFEDRAFKHLSSGMKSRLAFSIASFVQPEILILDEVMAVGDGGFWKKSQAKTWEIIEGGATTIMVSHALEQIRSMCNKILWIHKGEQITFGDNAQEICDDYDLFLDGTMSLEEVKAKYWG